MPKLNSIAEFRSLQERLQADRGADVPTIVIPAGTCGQASGASDIIKVAKRELLARGLTERVHLRITGCHGFCQMEPSVLVEPGRTFYPRVGLKEMARIVEAVAEGKVLTDLLFVDPVTGAPVERQEDIPFFRRQVRTILGRNEKVDPIRIYNYIEHGGYGALVKALEKRSPAWVVEEVKASRLRGRGGAGFPTGTKWDMLARQPAERGKVLVCNADEGDPGAYMDRSVLEGHPHSIIEGMVIGAYATGASEGVIYVRNEYPLAIKHLVIALRQAGELGLVGQNILGTGFSFEIRMVRGAGAFVCGEETALIRSVEGKMGEPRQRPPFPVERGIDGRPTAINNVETWANIPIIINVGGAEFAKVGTPTSSGTKIFSLVGKIRFTGLVEVPMGMTVREIVQEVGGGPAGRAAIKAVQTGGPSGGCIPAEKFDLPIDYDSLAQAGSIMGSGGMIVMDEDTCMVDVAKYFMRFLKDESCGKCFTCRKGTQRMYELLDDISAGRATEAHIDLLEELARTVKDTTMCGLGQTASNPVLSTLRYYRHEYLHHVVDKKCDALVCKELVGAPCQATCPLGTEAWRYVALLEKGHYNEAYRVIRETNPFPSICARVCDHRCETRCRLGTGGAQPMAIRALKRFITDNVDPAAAWQRQTASRSGKGGSRVAVVGAGPAGLTAAHFLSMAGHQVTVFEAAEEPGGMLLSGIPSYRLPREVVRREIAALLDNNITVKCRTILGRDVTLDGLFADGFKAAFLALGAHQSLRLGLLGEDAEGVYPSMRFLKAFNLRGEELAKGRVGVIGGGNSAIDAARVALRQKGVREVTVYYRRTRMEMPAYQEEIEAALAEGIRIETLVTPVDVNTAGGFLTGVRFVRNKLGAPDGSGRRLPVALPGSEFQVPLDTLIVAISEHPESDCLASVGMKLGVGGKLVIDEKTLCTDRAGVFAGGDLVTGPNTVVDAIAAGRRAAAAIDRYLHGKALAEPPGARLPTVYVEPAAPLDPAASTARATPPELAPGERKKCFAEVESALSPDEAVREARRCLRCDLEFTRPKEAPAKAPAAAGAAAGGKP